MMDGREGGREGDGLNGGWDVVGPFVRIWRVIVFACPPEEREYK